MNKFGFSEKWFFNVLLLVIFGISISLDTFGEESFSDSLKNGKVNGELKIWYQTNENDTGEKENAKY